MEEPSREEADQLARSTKKAKMLEQDSPMEVSVVQETPLETVGGVTDPLGEGGDKKSDIFPTATGEALRRKVISYADVCMGNNGKRMDESESEDDMFLDSDMEEESSEEKEQAIETEPKDEDPLCPVMKVTKEELRKAQKPWRMSMIVKLLGKRVGLRFLQTRLNRMWQSVGAMDVIDLENDYFLVRFEDRRDFMFVFTEGPWYISDHCLIIQRWKPEFFPFEDELKKVAVWIRIPGLPMELYEKHILWRIGNTLGRTVKIDSNTLREKEGSRGEFYKTERVKIARICVEVDLRKVLVSKFELKCRQYNVEYEGLHMVCFDCGIYGHRKDECPMLVEKVM